jgi:hypothetical protein
MVRSSSNAERAVGGVVIRFSKYQKPSRLNVTDATVVGIISALVTTLWIEERTERGRREGVGEIKIVRF